MKIGMLVVVIIAVALIVGPMMMMRPSPALKRRESLRKIARARGVHFTMRNLPQQADAAAPPGAIPVYFLARKDQQNQPGWLLLRTNYEHELHFAGNWDWHGDVRPTQRELAVLKEFLTKLPASVKAVGGGQGAAVYWDETGDEAELTLLLDLLSALSDAAD